MDFGHLDTEFDSKGFDAKLDGNVKGTDEGYDLDQAFDVKSLGFFETAKDDKNDKEGGSGGIDDSKFASFGFGGTW